MGRIYIDGYNLITGIKIYSVFGPNGGCSQVDSSNNVKTLLPVTPLTADTQTLDNEIASMIPLGDTFIPLGMQIGWMTISPNSPFTLSDPSAPSGAPLPYGTIGLNKAVILLTDGCNHLTNTGYTGNINACDNADGASNVNDLDASFYTSVGYAWQKRLGNVLNGAVVDPMIELNKEGLADQRLSTLCQNMKASGKNITIYTIILGTQANAAPAVLKSCALSPDDYFAVADPANLNNVFLAIAEKLTLSRLIN